ncbi:hypothetical protein [Tenacibaculum sp. SZ-18]|nr:hypothetical protein [Tenacibaculum sp. SZ-18]
MKRLNNYGDANDFIFSISDRSINVIWVFGSSIIMIAVEVKIEMQLH